MSDFPWLLLEPDKYVERPKNGQNLVSTSAVFGGKRRDATDPDPGKIQQRRESVGLERIGRNLGSRFRFPVGATTESPRLSLFRHRLSRYPGVFPRTKEIK